MGTWRDIEASKISNLDPLDIEPEQSQPIATFGINDVMATFVTFTSGSIADQADGETAVFRAVALVKGAAEYPDIFDETCCAVADADGVSDAVERKVAI